MAREVGQPLKRIKVGPVVRQPTGIDRLLIQAVPRLSHERAVGQLADHIRDETRLFQQPLVPDLGHCTLLCLRPPYCSQFVHFYGPLGIAVSPSQKRSPDASWRPESRGLGRSATPSFIVEVGSSDSRQSLDDVAEEYLTGLAAEQV